MDAEFHLVARPFVLIVALVVCGASSCRTGGETKYNCPDLQQAGKEAAGETATAVELAEQFQNAKWNWPTQRAYKSIRKQWDHAVRTSTPRILVEFGNALDGVYRGWLVLAKKPAPIALVGEPSGSVREVRISIEQWAELTRLTNAEGLRSGSHQGVLDGSTYFVCAESEGQKISFVLYGYIPRRDDGFNRKYSNEISLIEAVLGLGR